MSYYSRPNGSGAGVNLPPLDEAISNEEGYGRNSGLRRASQRAANELPQLQTRNRIGQKNRFKSSLDSDSGAETLEPYVDTAKGCGFDKYAKDKKKKSTSSSSGHHHHHSSSSHRHSSKHDDSASDNDDKHHHHSSKGHKKKASKDKGKAKDQDGDDGASGGAYYGGGSTGGYYGGSSIGGYSASSYAGGSFYGSAY